MAEYVIIQYITPFFKFFHLDLPQKMTPETLSLSLKTDIVYPPFYHFYLIRSSLLTADL